MSVTQMSELERLRAENAALKAAANKAVTIKIGTKGGISVYGLGRFPTTLYPKQWARVFAVQDKIKEMFSASDAKVAELAKAGEVVAQ